MSNAFAIAAVTAVLRDVLFNGLNVPAVTATTATGAVAVTALPPDRVLPPNGADPDQLNLFLYQVTYNQGWRNLGLPSRNSAGERVSNPALPLDLHYLMTAYGSRDMNAEIILGHAMQLLHETAVLPHETIRKALSPTPVPANFPTQLADSGLADQIENIRITPAAMNTEESFRIWSSLQTHYRPTAAYQVSVVLIESARSFKAALPVSGVNPPEHPGRNIYVAPFHQPLIERIVAAADENAPITAGVKLLIKGRRLSAAKVRVLSGAIDLSSFVTQISETQITVELPAILPASMYAGILPLQVAHLLDLGAPPTEHRGVESNVKPFVLSPTITPTVNSAADGAVDGLPAKKGDITVNFNPKVSKRQRVVLLLNRINVPAGQKAYAYSFNAPKDNGVTTADTETASIKFPFKKIVAGNYLARVQVDGAENQLGMVTLPDGSKIYGSPSVTI
jgi:Pvc16 N-terminal domain